MTGQVGGETAMTAPRYDDDMMLEGTLDRLYGDELLNTESVWHEFIARDEHRALLAIGRELARLQAADVEQRAYLAAVKVDIEAARKPLLNRIAFLDEQVKVIALQRRERDPRVTHMDVPGLGRYQTRAVAGGWDIPSRKDARDEIMAALADDERPLIAPSVPVLSDSALRKHLDGFLLSSAENLAGRSDPDERVRALEVVAQALAESYHVERREPRMTVRGPLDG